MDGWLAPDGTFYGCPAYGHVYVAHDVICDRPEVRAAVEATASEAGYTSDMYAAPIDNIVTTTLERLGWLKLATRSGKTDWYYSHTLLRITSAQADTLLGLCRDLKQPWPAWVDRESLRVL